MSTALAGVIEFVRGLVDGRGTTVTGPLEIPALVRERARANRVAGQRWLDGLPDTVATLAGEWGLDIGRSLSGGTASLVVDAVDASGRPCVLKVPMPLDLDGDGRAFERSVLVHQLAAGRGCARLLAHTTEPPALLIERLGPNLDDLGLPVPAVLEGVAAALQSFWTPLGGDVALPTGADQAAWLADFISSEWTALDQPCDAAIIDCALTYCAERIAAFDPLRAVLVHGDGHGWNVLADPAGGFKLVDPEGLRSSPEHDLGILTREYNEPLLAGDTARLAQARVDAVATACGADPEAVWQWGYIERVATGLAGLRAFGAPGQAFLEVARRCVEPAPYRRRRGRGRAR